MCKLIFSTALVEGNQLRLCVAAIENRSGVGWMGGGIDDFCATGTSE